MLRVWQEALGSRQEDFQGPLHLLVASENKNMLPIVSALFLSALTTPNNKIFDFVGCCSHMARQQRPGPVHTSILLLHKAGEALAPLKYKRNAPKSDLIRFDRIVFELHVVVCLVFVCPTPSGWLRNQRFYYWGWFTKTGSLAQVPESPLCCACGRKPWVPDKKTFRDLYTYL